MQDISARILDNLLDNLDRLYDRLCTPEDTRALLIASAEALASTDWSATLAGAAEAIHAYPMVEGGYPDALRDAGWYEHALLVTDELRKLLANDWSRRHGEK